MLRNIRKSFNEYRELAIQAVLAIAIFITASVILALKLDEKAVYRCTITLLVCTFWMGEEMIKQVNLGELRIVCGDGCAVSLAAGGGPSVQLVHFLFGTFWNITRSDIQ